MTPPDDGTREEIIAKMAALARLTGTAAQLNEEIAGLREEIASLRRQIAAQTHGCCHHSCWHYPYYNPITTTITYPQTWTTGTGTITYGTGGAIT